MTALQNIRSVAAATIALAVVAWANSALAQQGATSSPVPAPAGADAPWRNVTPEPGVVVSGNGALAAPVAGYPAPAATYVAPPVYVAPAPIYVAPPIYPRPWGWGAPYGYGYGYAPGISLNLGYTYHRH